VAFLQQAGVLELFGVVERRERSEAFHLCETPGTGIACPMAFHRRRIQPSHLTQGRRMKIDEAAQATEFNLPQWSVAEFLDTPYADGLVLRALVCRLKNDLWQWSILSIGKEMGELISIGTENSLAEARRTAAVEIDKCIRDPLI
jgi:hypothetical protein